MIQWQKSLVCPDGLVYPDGEIFVIPEKSGGCDIWYGDECAKLNITVKEFMNKAAKVFDDNIDISKLTKTEVKAMIENIIYGETQQ